MAQKPMLREEVYARALRASQNVKRAEVYRKPVFRICLIRWAAFCLLRSFLELFLKRRKWQKSPCFFSVTQGRAVLTNEAREQEECSNKTGFMF